MDDAHSKLESHVIAADDLLRRTTWSCAGYLILWTMQNYVDTENWTVPDATLKPSERKWAQRAYIALYVLLIAMPITGYVMTSFHGFPTYFFGWEFQPLWDKSQAYVVWGSFHKYILQYLIYIILGAHIAGALKHHFIDKQLSAFKRMVSWTLQ